MGCVLSKKEEEEEEEDVVALCRERTRLLKMAVERRYAFSDAHLNYNHSLYAVAAAIRLFLARHSSPSSPFLITFPSSSSHPTLNITDNQNFLQHLPTLPVHQTLPCQPATCTVSLKRDERVQEPETQVTEQQINEEEEDEEEEEEEDDDDDDEVLCEHFYDEVVPKMPSPNMEFGWDFFNPFDNGVRTRTEEVSELGQRYEENLRAVREQEGIPELEEDGERVVRKVAKVAHKETGVSDEKTGDDKGLKMVDEPTIGRELLEALKDVEDHFSGALNSGLDISRMLEATKVQMQSGFEEIKEKSSKLLRSITLSKTSLSRSSSCRSLLSSSSRNSSMWTDLFDDYGGMESGSHSLTLERLYAWEKKLYEEVKSGEKARKSYEQKCSQLRRKDGKGDGLWLGDKTRSEVKELYSRISVAVRSVESISKRIEKLRDEELEPQLVELLHGLMKNWKIMLQTHEAQTQIMLDVTAFSCPAIGKFRNDSHRLATLQLEAELHSWHDCFVAYVSTQKAYVEALGAWLSKFIAPEVGFYSSCRSSPLPPGRINGPPALVTCHDWLMSLENLPVMHVRGAMKCFGKDIHALWTQQGVEQHQKRKVDGLAKELDRRTLVLQRAERRILEAKISGKGSESDMFNGIEYLAERKKVLDLFKKRLESEKAKHQISMQETQQITINGFQMGFSSVFQSLAEFSKSCVQMYADLVRQSENAEVAKGEDSNESYIEEISSYLTS